jgi:methionyl-tRNA formyltransferase
VNISVVCSDLAHPIIPHLKHWCALQSAEHQTELVSDLSDLSGGDLLLLISCSQIVPAALRNRYGAALVIHASDLPAGRGWSPLVWQIVEGRNDIVVSLLEAADPVDTGAVWSKRSLHFNGTELFDEINAALFGAELELMNFAVSNLGQVQPVSQSETGTSWYPRRRPEDSRIDPNRSLAEQFDLLRIADPMRYPAFFDYRGERYEIAIRKQNKDE